MAKLRPTEIYQRDITAEIKSRLPDGWEVVEHVSVRKNYSWGYGYVSAGVSYKGSPYVDIKLTYGVYHTCLAQIFRTISIAKYSREPSDFPQFYADTVNQRLGKGPQFAFDHNYKSPNIVATIDMLLNSTSHGKPLQDLELFMTRFGDIMEIRKAIDDYDNSFMFQGGRDLAVIDVYLNDLAHLRESLRSRRYDYERNQIDEVLQVLGVTL